MRRPPWWLLALLVLLAFAFQGTRGIWEPDEGRYTATALNMLESGDWLVPTLDGEHAHLTKPPVVYWSIAGSIGTLGYNEWAARLPGALAFIGTGLLVFGLGRRFCPGKPWLPATAWALSLAPVVGANVVSTDVLLMFGETAAMFAFVEAWFREGKDRRRWVLGMWFGWALAFMTKGPPGLLPLAAMVAFLAIHDRGRLRGLFAPAGLLLFAVAGFTWFVLIVYQEPGRLGYFLGYEVYDRVFTAAHDRNAQWYGAFEVYLPVLLLGALPWPALAVAALGGPREAWRWMKARVRERDRETLLLLYWFVLPLAVFCIARSRLQLYVLPLFVPLAVMSARPLARWAWLDGRRLATIAGLTAVVSLGIKGTLAYVPSDRDSRRTAAAIAEVLDTEGIEEIAFVGMRPFYGLDLYLDVRIEAVHFERDGVDYSQFLAGDTLCSELGTREKNVFAVKRSRSARFLAAVGRCSELTPVEVARFQADDNEIVLYTVRPPAGQKP
jgi:4-amino-4-deoxy-L-arabinose transferase-like glycosyltransferase